MLPGGKGRVAVLVAGMHRSGTSATTRLLSLVGCDLPKTLMEADPDSNETGFWESLPIVHLNDEVLRSAGSAWSDWRPFDPGWYASPVAGEFRERARAALLEEYGDSRLFVLKDPRICRLLELWTDALGAIGADVRIVSTLRNPDDVAASLKARDGIDASVGRLLWLRNVLDAEAATRHLRRAYLRYDSLLSDPHAAVDAVGGALGVSWPRRSSAGARMEIGEFFSSRLRHHRIDDARLLADPRLSRWISSSFEIFERWCRGEPREEDLGRLDRIRSAFDEAAAAFSLPLAAGERAVAERDARIEGLRQAVAERDARIERLRRTVAGRDVRIEGRRRAVAERDARIEGLRRTVAGRDGRIEGLQRALAERDARIEGLQRAMEALYGSTSWRIAAPVRAVRRLERRLRTGGRAAVSRTARTVYRRTPLPFSLKKRIKDGLFRAAPPLFRHTAAYRSWTAGGPRAPSTGAGRQAAPGLLPGGGRTAGRNEPEPEPRSRTDWGIVTPPHTRFVAALLARRLREHGWKADVLHDAPAGFPHRYYVVVCPHVFRRNLPPKEKRIVFQMEQSVTPKYFTQEYFDILNGSLRVLDYSLENVDFLKKNLVAHVDYVPLGAMSRYGEAVRAGKECDVLFYGDAGSPRRKYMLEALEKHFDVRIMTGVYGREMEKAIKGARLAVNIHFYEEDDLLLETTRIYECLSLGTPVVSETARDQDDYPELAGVVAFFEKGSIGAMLRAVGKALEAPAGSDELGRSVQVSEARFRFMFDSFLVASKLLPGAHMSAAISEEWRRLRQAGPSGEGAAAEAWKAGRAKLEKIRPWAMNGQLTRGWYAWRELRPEETLLARAPAPQAILKLAEEARDAGTRLIASRRLAGGDAGEDEDVRAPPALRHTPVDAIRTFLGSRVPPASAAEMPESGGFTIVTPFSGRVDFFGKTAASVARLAEEEGPAGPALEWIVVNDALSVSDETLARRVPEGLRRAVRQIRPAGEKGGIVDALNRGIREGRRRWMLFLDCGDELEPNAAAVLKHYVERFPRCRYISSSLIDVDEHGDVLRFRGNEHSTERLFDAGLAAGHPIAVRRDLFEEIGPFDPRFEPCQDYEFALRTAMHEPILLIPEPLYRRRWRAPGRPASPGRGGYAVRQRIRREYMGRFLARNGRAGAGAATQVRPRSRRPGELRGAAVIRTRNLRPDLLAEAVDSVRIQSRLTPIVVVHGSEDDLRAVEDRFPAEDSTVVLFASEALGPGRRAGYPANVALDYVAEQPERFDYVCFLDDDDVFYPFFAARMSEALAWSGADLVYGIPNQRVPWQPAEAGQMPLPSGCLVVDNFIACNTYVLAAGFLRRTGARFDESLRYCEDWDFLLTLWAAGARFRFIAETVSEYRIVGDGQLPAAEKRRPDLWAANAAQVKEKARKIARATRGGLARLQHETLDFDWSEARRPGWTAHMLRTAHVLWAEAARRP